jgi:cellulose synthase/poly-beta-1,6-N-acetylglucosamine synthase-like glycosyltransferase/spore germination protein YaaH/peptidoglycan/xylan/chitin deacetylase (PgdA/CDA1 family)
MGESGQHRQVFETSSPKRWRRFKWATRLATALLLLAAGVIAFTVYRVNNPSLPQLRDKSLHYQSILHPKQGFVFRNRTNKAYRDFRQYINAAYKTHAPMAHMPAAGTVGTMPAAIRAGFYVNWDPQSLSSLRAHLPQMNMVLPEWFFLSPDGDSISTDIDSKALSLMEQSGIRIVPMLSNYIDSDFNGAALHRLLHSETAMARVIEQAVQLVKGRHFAGINVDFEEFHEGSDEPLIHFMQRLKQRFSAEGLLVTQDVAPANSDYNLKSLAPLNDYIFLMAYDQHQSETNPGAISDQSWIEASVEAAATAVPPDKLVLCVAAYGYDWPKGSKGGDITYAEAITTARESEAMPHFDSTSYNLHYSYSDDNDHPHEVWFTDAASNYNTLRFAAEYGLAGTSLWRLGSEDSRIWSFWNKDLSGERWKGFNLQSLSTIAGTNDIDYQGEGEVLDVAGMPQVGNVVMDVDSSVGLFANETYRQLPSSFVIRKFGKGDKQVVLTFDDGPDPDWTPQILDILKKERVPASFFMVGINAEDNIPLVRRVYSDGFEIGNHTFTHPNIAEVSKQRAFVELNATRLLIECITGHSTVMFRPPYNADAEPTTMQELEPVAFGKQQHYLTIGESIDPRDWENGVSADSIFDRVVAQASLGSIVLLHDAGGNRAATVEALPRIIHYFRDRGYTFTTIAALTGQTRGQLMPQVPHDRGYYLIQINYWLATAGYGLSHFFSTLFIFCLVASMLRLALTAALAWKQQRHRKQHRPADPQSWPHVAIIVPAYNEEVNAIASIQRLLALDYPDYEVLFVDDGSKDETLTRVRAALGEAPRLRILSKPNGGKASALNYGLARTDAPIVLCIDADTHLSSDVLRRLVPHFEDVRVAAVAGNVKVGNRVNLLTRWQHLEYVTSQNFDRLAFAQLNAIAVIPGAIGGFRKSALDAIGGFTTDTFAEDCDLTLRLISSGYRVTYDNTALAFTEAPEGIRMFLRQRFRWTFGVMQAFWKNRECLFRSSCSSLGWVVLPNILFFQIIIPMLTPFAGLFLLMSMGGGQSPVLLWYYIAFLLIDFGVSAMAFSFEGEQKRSLVWLLSQRIVYRWLMLYVLFKAIRRAISGAQQSWGVLKRSGKVQMRIAEQ